MDIYKIKDQIDKGDFRVIRDVDARREIEAILKAQRPIITFGFIKTILSKRALLDDAQLQFWAISLVSTVGNGILSKFIMPHVDFALEGEEEGDAEIIKSREMLWKFLL